MAIESQIYEILTRRRFSRENPKNIKQLKQIIEDSIDKNQPIKLIGFWGVGPKDKANWADTSSCEHLHSLVMEIKKIYEPGVEFTFIFATLHGIHNNIKKKIISSYTKTMEEIFRKYNFKFIYLDPLWKKYNIDSEKIKKIHKEKTKNWWSKIKNIDTIVKNARQRKHGKKSKYQAQFYYMMRDLEKEMLEKEFIGSIFHGFSSSKLDGVLPNMPTLYLFARKSWSDTPWFVTREKN